VDNAQKNHQEKQLFTEKTRDGLAPKMKWKRGGHEG
jgi:hypothetical protein